MLVKIDGDKHDAKELMKEYSVPGFPTFIALNAKGQTLNRWSGYTKEQWVARADETVTDPTTIEQKTARFQKSPTEKDAATLARYNDSMGKYKEAIDHYTKAADLSGGSKFYTNEIFEATFTGYEEKAFPVENVVTAAKSHFDKEKDAAELIVPARMMVYLGAKEDNSELAVPFVQTAIERTENTADPDAITQRKKLLPDYALLVLKDKEKAVAYKKESLGEGWTDRAGDLNRYAWWCFENKINLDEAYTMAGKGVQIAKPGAEKAQILDTLAELCNVKDDCTSAVKHIELAIKEDPDNKHYKEQLKRFQDLAAKQGK